MKGNYCWAGATLTPETDEEKELLKSLYNLIPPDQKGTGRGWWLDEDGSLVISND
jgi:hypothetical protein